MQFLFRNLDAARLVAVGIDQGNRIALDVEREKHEGMGRHGLAIPVGNAAGDLGVVDVADQQIHTLRCRGMEDVRREGQRKAELLRHLVGIRPEAETSLHHAGLGIADTQHDAAEAHGPVHRLEDDAQDVIELVTVDQGVADVLNAGGQHGLGIGCRNAGFAPGASQRVRLAQHRAIVAVGPGPTRPPERPVSPALGEQAHLLAKAGLLQVQVNDTSEIGHFLDGPLHCLLKLLLTDCDRFGKPGHGFLQFPVPRLGRRLGDHFAQLVGETGQHAQAFILLRRFPDRTWRQAPHGTDDQRREAPLASNRHTHVLERNTEHLPGRHILIA